MALVVVQSVVRRSWRGRGRWRWMWWRMVVEAVLASLPALESEVQPAAKVVVAGMGVGRVGRRAVGRP